jgi:hypothetical protein
VDDEESAYGNGFSIARASGKNPSGDDLNSFLLEIGCSGRQHRCFMCEAGEPISWLRVSLSVGDLSEELAQLNSTFVITTDRRVYLANTIH